MLLLALLAVCSQPRLAAAERRVAQCSWETNV
jgi:hypothetical protein